MVSLRSLKCVNNLFYEAFFSLPFTDGGLGNINDALQGSLTYQPAVSTEDMDLVVNIGRYEYMVHLGGGGAL